MPTIIIYGSSISVVHCVRGAPYPNYPAHRGAPHPDYPVHHGVPHPSHSVHHGASYPVHHGVPHSVHSGSPRSVHPSVTGTAYRGSPRSVHRGVPHSNHPSHYAASQTFTPMLSSQITRRSPLPFPSPLPNIPPSLNFPSPSNRNSPGPTSPTLLVPTPRINPLVEPHSPSKVLYDVSEDPRRACIVSERGTATPIPSEAMNSPVIEGAPRDTRLQITFDNPVLGVVNVTLNSALTIGELIDLLHSLRKERGTKGRSHSREVCQFRGVELDATSDCSTNTIKLRGKISRIG